MEKHGCKVQTGPYAIHEAALIFEAKVSDRLDLVIGVIISK